MSPFQLWGLVGAVFWLAAVGLWFRRSTLLLIGGLVVVAAYAAVSAILDPETLTELGLAAPASVYGTVMAALLGVLAMLGASPLADRLASAVFKKPPTLGTFKALQQSRAKLIGGIALAWLLGGVLEEVALRGVILRAVEAALPAGVLASLAGVVAAAAGAWVLHLYQGLRAALIVSILSLLLGGLFVLSGYNLWAVMLCHGLYDTVAFIRFALGRSKYSKPAAG